MATIDAQTAGSLEAVVFCDLIAWSEGCSVAGGNTLTQNDGYDIIVQGVGDPHGGEIFTDYTDHPFANGRPAKLIVAPGGTRLPEGLHSTASGRYQFILPTWKSLKAKLDLPDFSPESQDKAAIELLRECCALAQIQAGDISKAVEAAAKIWASLPGNDYGQGGHSLEAVLAEFAKLQA